MCVRLFCKYGTLNISDVTNIYKYLMKKETL